MIPHNERRGRDDVMALPSLLIGRDKSLGEEKEREEGREEERDAESPS